jgi:hypothetical protein
MKVTVYAVVTYHGGHGDDVQVFGRRKADVDVPDPRPSGAARRRTPRPAEVA